MTISTRHYLVHDGEIRPLTQSTLDRLRRGELRLPGYAGQDLHVVDVRVEVQKRAPVKIRDMTTSLLSLDGQGALRSRLLEDLQASLAASRTGRGAAPPRWAPSQALRDRIADLALDRSASKLKSPRAAAAASTAKRAAARGKRRLAGSKVGE